MDEPNEEFYRWFASAIMDIGRMKGIPAEAVDRLSTADGMKTLGKIVDLVHADWRDEQRKSAPRLCRCGGCCQKKHSPYLHASTRNLRRSSQNLDHSVKSSLRRWSIVDMSVESVVSTTYGTSRVAIGNFPTTHAESTLPTPVPFVASRTASERSGRGFLVVSLRAPAGAWQSNQRRDILLLDCHVVATPRNDS